MSKKILITGGAGFLGSHLADDLLNHGYEIRVLDNLSKAIHGNQKEPPEYLDPFVDFQLGDIRNPDDVTRALEGVDVVFHLAAAVDVGQSFHEINHTVDVNNRGTAVLLEALIKKPVEKLIIASSMSLYGEGLYRAPDGTEDSNFRSPEQMKNGDWEVTSLRGEKLDPIPTPETKNPDLHSIYALSKLDQEQMAFIIGRTHGIPTCALRFFNVYGTRQSLFNPYTGVMAVFASRLLNNKSPIIFEDGLQQRDFLNVLDAVQACRLALESEECKNQAFNIGSGQHYTIQEIAYRMAAALGKEHIHPVLTGEYRLGDIRHCYADITKARHMLGFTPTVNFDEGLAELADWLSGQITIESVSGAENGLLTHDLALS